MKTSGGIIDIHCHTAGIGAGGSGCSVSAAMRRNWRYRLYLKAFGLTEQELASEGDSVVLRRLSQSLAQSARVRAAVILAMDGVVGSDGAIDPSKTEMYIPNEFLAAETLRYPNLLFGASVNPYRKDALPRLERCAEQGAVLVKWLPSIQHIDPADRRIVPFYRRLRDLGLPLLTHTGSERSFTSAANHLADPERLRLPLSLGVTVVAAHAASNGSNCGERNHERFIRLCAEFENLYADISALTQMNRLGHLQRLLRYPQMEQRLLYGTDMPLLNTPIVTPLAFCLRLTPREILSLLRIRNPWDRDVALKELLGVSGETFRRAAGVIGEGGFRCRRAAEPS